MSAEVVNIKCPTCGMPVSTSDNQCKWCSNPVVIKTFNSVASMPIPEISKYANSYRKSLEENPDNQILNTSLAMCYLKLKLYDKALPAFEKAIEDNFDNAETFFYAAICILKGKKAFMMQRQEINKIEEYIDAALMIEPRGIFYYFKSYIRYDYHKRKCFNISPDYNELLDSAFSAGVSDIDIQQLFDILNVERPQVLKTN